MYLHPPVLTSLTPSSPSLLHLAQSVLLWCLERTRATAQHLSLQDISQTNHPPFWTESTITVCNGTACAHTLAEEGEVKKAGVEHRKRWAADLYAFIKTWPWSWMPLRQLYGSLHPHTCTMGAYWLHIKTVYIEKGSCRDRRRIFCTYGSSELHLYSMTHLSHTSNNQPCRLTGY